MATSQNEAGAITCANFILLLMSNIIIKAT